MGENGNGDPAEDRSRRRRWRQTGPSWRDIALAAVAAFQVYAASFYFVYQRMHHHAVRENAQDEAIYGLCLEMKSHGHDHPIECERIGEIVERRLAANTNK